MPRKDDSDSDDEDIDIEDQEIDTRQAPRPLMSFQRNNVNLINSMLLAAVKCIFNMGMGGSGKTLQTLRTLIEMQCQAFIICPAKSQLIWINEASREGALDHIYAMASYNKFTTAEISKFNYTDKVRLTKLDVATREKLNAKSKLYNYTYKIPRLPTLFETCDPGKSKRLVFVFDECHKITTKSNASRAAMTLFKYMLEHPDRENMLFVCLSGTLIEKFERLLVYAFFCGYIPMPTLRLFKEFMTALHDKDLTSNPVTEFRKLLFSESDRRAVTVKQEDMDLGYPNIIECIRLHADDDTREQIAEANRNILRLWQQRQMGAGNAIHLLQEIQKERQVLSGLKPPFMARFAKIALKKGYSIAVYFCFHESFDEFVRLMKDYSPMLISGKERNMDKRDEIAWRFRNNAYRDGRKKKSVYDCRLLVLTTGTGSDSISLHDEVGQPHMFLFDIDWTLTVNIQQRWRGYRLGLKSGVRQYYVMWTGTYEERIRDLLNLKNDVLARLNNENVSVESADLFHIGNDFAIDYDRDTSTINITDSNIEDFVPNIDEELLTMKMTHNIATMAEGLTEIMSLPMVDVTTCIETIIQTSPSVIQNILDIHISSVFPIITAVDDGSIVITEYPLYLTAALQGYHANIEDSIAIVPKRCVDDVVAMLSDIGLINRIPDTIPALGNEPITIITNYVDNITLSGVSEDTCSALDIIYNNATIADSSITIPFTQEILEDLCERLNVVSITRRRNKGKGRATS